MAKTLNPIALLEELVHGIVDSIEKFIVLLFMSMFRPYRLGRRMKDGAPLLLPPLSCFLLVTFACCVAEGFTASIAIERIFNEAAESRGILDKSLPAISALGFLAEEFKTFSPENIFLSTLPIFIIFYVFARTLSFLVPRSVSVERSNLMNAALQGGTMALFLSTLATLAVALLNYRNLKSAEYINGLAPTFYPALATIIIGWSMASFLAQLKAQTTMGLKSFLIRTVPALLGVFAVFWLTYAYVQKAFPSGPQARIDRKLDERIEFEKNLHGLEYTVLSVVPGPKPEISLLIKNVLKAPVFLSRNAVKFVIFSKPFSGTLTRWSGSDGPAMEIKPDEFQWATYALNRDLAADVAALPKDSTVEFVLVLDYVNNRNRDPGRLKSVARTVLHPDQITSATAGIAPK